MALSGNGAKAVIYADGVETTAERRGTDVSRAGNQLSGTFTLMLRGWETEVNTVYMEPSMDQIRVICHPASPHCHLISEEKTSLKALAFL